MKYSRTKQTLVKSWTTVGIDDKLSKELHELAQIEERSDVGELRFLIKNRRNELGLDSEVKK